MIINNTDHEITLPFSPGNEVFGFWFSPGSVEVVSYFVDAVFITDAGDKVAHVRVYLRSNQHWIPDKDVILFKFNDDLMICSEFGLCFFNEGHANQQINTWKDADFTI